MVSNSQIFQAVETASVIITESVIKTQKSVDELYIQIFPDIYTKMKGLIFAEKNFNEAAYLLRQ